MFLTDQRELQERTLCKVFYLHMIYQINFTTCLQECVTVVGKRSDDGHTKTLPKPLREAAIQHAKEVTQQNMLDSLDHSKKIKKKRKVPPPHELGNTILS